MSNAFEPDASVPAPSARDLAEAAWGREVLSVTTGWLDVAATMAQYPLSQSMFGFGELANRTVAQAARQIARAFDRYRGQSGDEFGAHARRWRSVSDIPTVVVERSPNGTFGVVDGGHRTTLAWAMGWPRLPAAVVEIGTHREARLELAASLEPPPAMVERARTWLVAANRHLEVRLGIDSLHLRADELAADLEASDLADRPQAEADLAKTRERLARWEEAAGANPLPPDTTLITETYDRSLAERGRLFRDALGASTTIPLDLAGWRYGSTEGAISAGAPREITLITYPFWSGSHGFGREDDPVEAEWSQDRWTVTFYRYSYYAGKRPDPPGPPTGREFGHPAIAHEFRHVTQSLLRVISGNPEAGGPPASVGSEPDPERGRDIPPHETRDVEFHTNLEDEIERAVRILEHDIAYAPESYPEKLRERANRLWPKMKRSSPDRWREAVRRFMRDVDARLREGRDDYIGKTQFLRPERPAPSMPGPRLAQEQRSRRRPIPRGEPRELLERIRSFVRDYDRYSFPDVDNPGTFFMPGTQENGRLVTYLRSGDPAKVAEAVGWMRETLDRLERARPQLDAERDEAARTKAYESQGHEFEDYANVTTRHLEKARAGKVWLYNGTSSELLPEILRDGLIPDRKRSDIASDRHRPGWIFLTPHAHGGPASAQWYAQQAAAAHGGWPTVLRVLVDGRDLERDHDPYSDTAARHQFKIHRVEPNQIIEVGGVPVEQWKAEHAAELGITAGMFVGQEGWLEPDGTFHDNEGMAHAVAGAPFARRFVDPAPVALGDVIEMLLSRYWTRVGYSGTQHLFTVKRYGRKQRRAIENYLAQIGAAQDDLVSIEDWDEEIRDWDGTVGKFFDGDDRMRRASKERMAPEGFISPAGEFHQKMPGGIHADLAREIGQEVYGEELRLGTSIQFLVQRGWTRVLASPTRSSSSRDQAAPDVLFHVARFNRAPIESYLVDVSASGDWNILIEDEAYRSWSGTVAEFYDSEPVLRPRTSLNPTTLEARVRRTAEDWPFEWSWEIDTEHYSWAWADVPIRNVYVVSPERNEMHEDVVEDNIQRIRAGEPITAVIGHVASMKPYGRNHEPQPGDYWVPLGTPDDVGPYGFVDDGMHRCEAARRLGISHIRIQQQLGKSWKVQELDHGDEGDEGDDIEREARVVTADGKIPPPTAQRIEGASRPRDWWAQPDLGIGGVARYKVTAEFGDPEFHPDERIVNAREVTLRLAGLDEAWWLVFTESSMVGRDAGVRETNGRILIAGSADDPGPYLGGAYWIGEGGQKLLQSVYLDESLRRSNAGQVLADELKALGVAGYVGPASDAGKSYVRRHNFKATRISLSATMGERNAWISPDGELLSCEGETHGYAAREIVEQRHPNLVHAAGEDEDTADYDLAAFDELFGLGYVRMTDDTIHGVDIGFSMKMSALTPLIKRVLDAEVEPGQTVEVDASQGGSYGPWLIWSGTAEEFLDLSVDELVRAFRKQAARYAPRGYGNRNLMDETNRARESGGISSKMPKTFDPETREWASDTGLRPGFIDRATGKVYESRYGDGKPCGIHLIDGLPDEVALERNQHGEVIDAVPTLESGFLTEDGIFLTREEAAERARGLVAGDVTDRLLRRLAAGNWTPVENALLRFLAIQVPDEFLHGTSKTFEVFQNGAHGLVYLSAVDPHRKTQAEWIAGGPFGGRLLRVRLARPLKWFDPLNDPEARGVVDELIRRQGWDEDSSRHQQSIAFARSGYPHYSLAPLLVEIAAPLGYEGFRFYEDSVQGYSYAVTDPSALQVVGEIPPTKPDWNELPEFKHPERRGKPPDSFAPGDLERRAQLLAVPPERRHPMSGLPPGTLERNKVENADELERGVFTTTDENRAAAYANNFATVEDPPVVIAVDAGGLDPRADVDAILEMVDDMVRYGIESAVEPAREILGGDPAAAERMREALSKDWSDDGGGDPLDSVGDALMERRAIPASQILEWLEEDGLDDRGIAEAIVAIWDENRIPERVLAKATDQYRYPHDIHQERILWAKIFWPWRNELADYQDLEDWDGPTVGKQEWPVDDEGYVLFSDEGASEAAMYGWLPERGMLWENPQLRIEGFLPPTRVEYHGTTLSKARGILPANGWKMRADADQPELDFGKWPVALVRAVESLGESDPAALGIKGVRTAADGSRAFGNAAYVHGGEIVGYHVTDDAAGLVAFLDAGGDVLGGRAMDKFGDLGAGLYVSAAPQLWTGRSPGKWDFLKGLDDAQRQALADAIRNSWHLTNPGYVSKIELERALEDLDRFVADGSHYIVYLSGQPYNIPFWKREYLEPLGIPVGRGPDAVEIRLTGRYVELDGGLRDYALPDALRAAGYQGMFTRSGFTTVPQLVIWDSAAIRSARLAGLDLGAQSLDAVPPADERDVRSAKRALEWVGVYDIEMVERRRIPIQDLYGGVTPEGGWEFGALAAMSPEQQDAALAEYAGLSFRDHYWMERAREWIARGDVPTLVGILYPKGLEIEDGYSRMRIAVGMGWDSVPVEIYRIVPDEEGDEDVELEAASAAIRRNADLPEAINALEMFKASITMTLEERARELIFDSPDAFLRWADEQGIELPADAEDRVNSYDLSTIDPRVIEEFGEYEANFYMQHDPVGAPSFLHYEFRGDFPGGWLVHQSDDPWAIALHGLRYGFEDWNRMGLTTYYTDEVRKRSPGLNFAFKVGHGKQGKYGVGAVMFQVPRGVEVYHWGDSENQVVFVGAEATNFVVLEASPDLGWCAYLPNEKLIAQRFLTLDDISEYVERSGVRTKRRRRKVAAFSPAALDRRVAMPAAGAALYHGCDGETARKIAADGFVRWMGGEAPKGKAPALRPMQGRTYWSSDPAFAMHHALGAHWPLMRLDRSRTNAEGGLVIADASDFAAALPDEDWLGEQVISHAAQLGNIERQTVYDRDHGVPGRTYHVSPEYRPDVAERLWRALPPSIQERARQNRSAAGVIAKVATLGKAVNRWLERTQGMADLRRFLVAAAPQVAMPSEVPIREVLVFDPHLIEPDVSNLREVATSLPIGGGETALSAAALERRVSISTLAQRWDRPRLEWLPHWLYHVTTADRLPAIAARGLGGGQSIRGKLYEDPTDVFLTDAAGVEWWFRNVSLHVEQGFEPEEHEARAPVLLRIDVAQLDPTKIHEDRAGSRDARSAASRYTGRVPAGAIDAWIGSWVPVAEATDLSQVATSEMDTDGEAEWPDVTFHLPDGWEKEGTGPSHLTRPQVEALALRTCLLEQYQLDCRVGLGTGRDYGMLVVDGGCGCDDGTAREAAMIAGIDRPVRVIDRMPHAASAWVRVADIFTAIEANEIVASNPRAVLEATTRGIHDLIEAATDADLAGIVDEFSTRLVDAVVAIDRTLTGKDDNRQRARDLADAEKACLGDRWIVHLSDGGYSRLVIDPFEDKVGLDRGVSRPDAVERWDALAPFGNLDSPADVGKITETAVAQELRDLEPADMECTAQIERLDLHQNPADRARLEALMEEANRLDAEATAAYERGELDLAEELDARAVETRDRAEEFASALETDDEPSETSMNPEDLLHAFAALYARYLSDDPQDGVSRDRDGLISALRYEAWGRREDVSDDDLIAAAADAYQRLSMLRRRTTHGDPVGDAARFLRDLEPADLERTAQLAATSNGALYHTTTEDDLLEILEDGELLGADQSSGSYISFSEFPFDSLGLSSGIGVALEFDRAALGNEVQKVEYTREWLEANPLEAEYIAGSGWEEQLWDLDEYEDLDDDPDADHEELDDDPDAADAARAEALWERFSAHAEEREWITITSPSERAVVPLAGTLRRILVQDPLLIPRIQEAVTAAGLDVSVVPMAQARTAGDLERRAQATPPVGHIEISAQSAADDDDAELLEELRRSGFSSLVAGERDLEPADLERTGETFQRRANELRLYHGTSSEFWESIVENGQLDGPVYLTNFLPLAERFGEYAAGRRGINTVVILEVRIPDESRLRADLAMYADPEDGIVELDDDAEPPQEQDWKSSLAEVMSVKYDGDIPLEFVRVAESPEMLISHTAGDVIDIEEVRRKREQDHREEMRSELLQKFWDMADRDAETQSRFPDREQVIEDLPAPLKALVDEKLLDPEPFLMWDFSNPKAYETYTCWLDGMGEEGQVTVSPRVDGRVEVEWESAGSSEVRTFPSPEWAARFVQSKLGISMHTANTEETSPKGSCRRAQATRPVGHIEIAAQSAADDDDAELLEELRISGFSSLKEAERVFTEELNWIEVDGRRCYAGVISTMDLEIEETVTFRQAMESGHHHASYLSPAALERVDAGESVLFVGGKGGRLVFPHNHPSQAVRRELAQHVKPANVDPRVSGAKGWVRDVMFEHLERLIYGSTITAGNLERRAQVTPPVGRIDPAAPPKGPFRLREVYDIRPIDFATGKRMPLEPGEGMVCNRCGRLHAKVYVVEDIPTGRTYTVGSGCCKRAFEGWEPPPDEMREARKRERERKEKAIEAREAEIAAEVVARVGEITVPQPVWIEDEPDPHWPREVWGDPESGVQVWTNAGHTTNPQRFQGDWNRRYDERLECYVRHYIDRIVDPVIRELTPKSLSKSNVTSAVYEQIWPGIRARMPTWAPKPETSTIDTSSPIRTGGINRRGRLMRLLADWGTWSKDRARVDSWSGESSPHPVPDDVSIAPLYHATTALSSVLADGLRTREQQGGGSGRGLGGGPDDRISLTYDPAYAHNVAKSLNVLRAAIAGELSIADLNQIAKDGGWWPQMVEAYDMAEGPMVDPARHLEMAARGYYLHNRGGSRSRAELDAARWIPWDKGFQGRDEVFHTAWWKPMVEEERDGARYDNTKWRTYKVVKAFVAGAENAGISADPTFLGTDIEALGRVPASEIGVVEVVLRPGAKVTAHPHEREIRADPADLEVVGEATGFAAAAALLRRLADEDPVVEAPPADLVDQAEPVGPEVLELPPGHRLRQAVLGDLVRIKVGDPAAHFWLERRVTLTGARPGESFKDEIARLKRDHAAAFEDYLRDFRPGLEFRSRKEGRPGWSFVAPEMSSMADGDAWRVQNFDEDGFFGHTSWPTLEQARDEMFRRLWRYDDDRVIPDSGALHRFQGTQRWEEGMERARRVQRFNEESWRRSQQGLGVTDDMIRDLHGVPRDASVGRLLRRLSSRPGPDDVIWMNADDPETPSEIVEALRRGWEVYNAPRPMLGTESVQGPFRHGVFYGLVDPADTFAERFREQNLDLDGWPVRITTNDEMLAELRQMIHDRYGDDPMGADTLAEVEQAIASGDDQEIAMYTEMLQKPWARGRRTASLRDDLGYMAEHPDEWRARFGLPPGSGTGVNRYKPPHERLIARLVTAGADDDLRTLDIVDPSAEEPRAQALHDLAEALAGLGLAAQVDEIDPTSSDEVDYSSVVEPLVTLTGAPRDKVQAVMREHGQWLTSIREEVLTRSFGFSPTQAKKMVAAVRLALEYRGTRGPTYRRTRRISSPAAVAELVLRNVKVGEQEQFGFIALDGRGTPIATQVVHIGTITASLVSPAEVFRRALALRAVSIILFHNHPSDDVMPSPEDIQITQRLVRVGQDMGIRVLDHVVVSAAGHYASLQSMGQMPGVEIGALRRSASEDDAPAGYHGDEEPEFEPAIKLPDVVEVAQMEEPFDVETPEGPVEGKAGDWLVRGPAGDEWPIDQDIFDETYELVDELDDPAKEELVNNLREELDIGAPA